MVCNKKTVESLIKAGAFDSLGHTRRGLLAVHADAIDAFLDVKRNEAVGQFDLFGDLFDDEPERTRRSWSRRPSRRASGSKADLLAFEREMLGLYVSDHPLFGLEHVLAKAADCSIAALNADEARRADGKVVNLGRHPVRRAAARSPSRARPGRRPPWRIWTARSRCMFFPQTLRAGRPVLAEDAIVVVKGRLDRREDSPEAHRAPSSPCRTCPRDRAARS